MQTRYTISYGYGCVLHEKLPQGYRYCSMVGLSWRAGPPNTDGAVTRQMMHAKAMWRIMTSEVSDNMQCAAFFLGMGGRDAGIPP